MQTEPIRSKKHIKEMAGYYLKQGKLRNYLLIILGIYTGLRISDMLRLTKADVYNFEAGKIRTHIHITEGKTGKTKTIALNKAVTSALSLCFGKNIDTPDDFLFQTNRKTRTAIGRTQAWRIIKEAANAVGIVGCIGCHSLRKTLGYHAWKSGVKAVLLMDIFNHSSFEITKRYLGISQDDRDNVYLKLALV
jgi:Site-specific recombinase XerD